MNKKKVIIIVVCVLGAIWAARVIEAVVARTRVPPPDDIYLAGAEKRILLWELQVMEANERVIAALVPFVGGPLCRAATGGKREKKLKGLEFREAMARTEATTERWACETQIIKARNDDRPESDIMRIEAAQRQGGSKEAQRLIDGWKK